MNETKNDAKTTDAKTADRMKITDQHFAADMADVFEEGIRRAVEQKSDAFSFEYQGAPHTGSAAGVADDMKCLVLLMPAPLADLMQEGLVAARASLEQVLAASVAEKAAKQ